MKKEVLEILNDCIVNGKNYHAGAEISPASVSKLDTALLIGAGLAKLTEKTVKGGQK